MTRVLLTLAALAAILTVGCTPIPPSQTAGDPQIKVRGEVPDSVAVIVLEPTGKADVDVRALRTFEKIVRTYCTQEAGDANKIVLARVADPPVVETMSAAAFKAQYGTADGLKGLMKTPAAKSRVYDTICEAVTEAKPYLGKGRAAMFVFSPMLDTYTPPPNPMGMTLRRLVEFDHKGGAIGFYGVDRVEAHRLRLCLDGLIRNYVVASASDADWPMPEWK